VKKLLGLLFIAAFPALFQAQTATTTTDSLTSIYRAVPEKINDLVHTKLEARFDYEKAYMYGKVWITLEPHFYSTDSLVLDAKGMEIEAVAIAKRTVTTPLKYQYNGKQLHIKLDKLYKKGEKYKV
jgi:aminopeptidase N